MKKRGACADKIKRFVVIGFLLLQGCAHSAASGYGKTQLPASAQVDRQISKQDASKKELRKRIKKCYAKALRKNRRVIGMLYIQWTIDKQGRAFNIRTLQDTVHFDPLRQCVETSIAEHQFPASKSIVTVKHRHNFRHTIHGGF